jgi:hypothetical protein
MKNNKLSKLIAQSILAQLIDFNIKKWEVTIVFTLTGSSSTRGRYLIDDTEYEGVPTLENDLIKKEFELLKSDLTQRFNKIEIVVSIDGNYDINYFWDEESIHESKITKAKNMSGWLSQRIPTMISTQGYALYEQFRFEGDLLHNEEDASLYSSKKGWINGVFTFDFRNENLKITIEVEKITGRVELPIELPDWFNKDLWEHHNITNNGLLSKDWKPWNVLEIKLEKDIGHQGGKSIEPEINYMLI